MPPNGVAVACTPRRCTDPAHTSHARVTIAHFFATRARACVHVPSNFPPAVALAGATRCSGRGKKGWFVAPGSRFTTARCIDERVVGERSRCTRTRRFALSSPIGIVNFGWPTETKGAAAKARSRMLWQEGTNGTAPRRLFRPGSIESPSLFEVLGSTLLLLTPVDLFSRFACVLMRPEYLSGLRPSAVIKVREEGMEQ